MATDLDLDQPDAPQPPRKPRRPSGAAAAPSRELRWWQRRSPVADRIVVTLALFSGCLWGSMYLAQLEVAWNAAVPGSGEVWNQPHRHVQFAAGTLFGWLLVGLYDCLGFRSVTLGEAIRNLPNPGREDVFEPMAPTVRAAVIRFYGLIYAAIPIAQAIVWGN